MGADGNLWFPEFDGDRIGRLAFPQLAAAVPTMTELGIIILITLLGMGSVYHLRRRGLAILRQFL
jgi:hypothetical protein